MVRILGARRAIDGADDGRRGSKWWHFAGELILLCVRCIAYGISYRDLVERALRFRKGLNVRLRIPQRDTLGDAF